MKEAHTKTDGVDAPQSPPRGALFLANWRRIACWPRSRFDAPMPELTTPTRQQKITLGEMRASGVRGLLVDCSDCKCARLARISADRWSDHLRLSDLEAIRLSPAAKG